jgi:hypothetical protein
MTQEFDDKLVEKYPKFFRDRHGDMKKTCMVWGMDCNNGWYWLIDNLCDSIQSYIDNNSKRKRIKNSVVRFFIEVLWKLRKWSFLRKKLSYEFIKGIEDRFEKEEYETIPQVIATQVKEKFGGLRFYYNGGDEKIDGMVWLAEHMSYQICEECGTTENLGQTKGWIKTLCGDCAKNTNNSKRVWEKYKE